MKLKKLKIILAAIKFMATEFWEAKEIVCIDYLEKGKTINGQYYAELLQRLKDVVKNKRPN